MGKEGSLQMRKERREEYRKLRKAFPKHSWVWPSGWFASSWVGSRNGREEMRAIPYIGENGETLFIEKAIYERGNLIRVVGLKGI